VVAADPTSKQVAQILEKSWGEIGVRLKIASSAAGTDPFTTGEYEVLLGRPGDFISDVPVDDQFAGLLFASPETHNLFSWYENPVPEKLARQAVVELDEDKRRQLFEQLHVESMKKPSVIPLVYTPNRAAVANNVHAFNYLLNGWWLLDSVVGGLIKEPDRAGRCLHRLGRSGCR
jgi:peptide/nickel transport system substrate-binding protein